MKVKLGWMDSITFNDELGGRPTVQIHRDEATCRKEHECIQLSEEHPEQDSILNCHALQVVVLSAKDWASIVPILQKLKHPMGEM